MMCEPGTAGLCNVNCEHIAACANKCPKCVSWGYDGLIAVGSGQSIVICQEELRKGQNKFKRSVKSLNSNEGRINCVCWIRNMGELPGSFGNFLISGSANGTLTIWGCKKTYGYSYSFDVMCSLKKHNGAITCLDSIMRNDNSAGNQHRSYIVASSGIDSSVKIWRNTSSCIKSLSLFQCINLNPSLCLTLSLHTLNHTPILACGMDNSKVNLYTTKKVEGEDTFSHALSLIGHEDWVRGSDFVSLKGNDVLLATSSQDGFIRLWRICLRENETCVTDLDTLKVKEMIFETLSSRSRRYVVTLDAVLSGHEGWVYSVHWSTSSSVNNTPYLLSSSMDKSVVLWKMDDESQIWIEDARFGEVGGNTLGFYGAYFSNAGSEIIAHSYNGALHLWEKSREGNIWNPGVIISGHFGAVQDISWEPQYGRYLLSTSSDQTTRLFAKWYDDKNCSWHEIARPQVHGYDMQSIAMIDSYRFISGADEKVLRIFEAPEIFLQNFKTIAKVTLGRKNPGPEGATVPALGLSNKAVFSTDNASQQETPTTRGEQYIENQFQKCLLTEPPTEEYLLQNSLWPETHKLYWHVFEIFCVTANSTGTLVATTAKSSSPEHSTIVLWDTSSWKEVGQLRGHTLTVTQIEFSINGQFLLSVSRDRTWVLHKLSGNTNSGYSIQLFAKSDKKTCHSRIIWSASWTHDSKYFCSGSRDKKVMFWKVNDGTNNTSVVGPVERILSTTFNVSVTAVAFCKSYVNGSNYLLAIGKENGLIELDTFIDSPNIACSTLRIFDVHEAHASCIKQMRWKPIDNEEIDEHHLATCGSDNMLKIFSICCENSAN